MPADDNSNTITPQHAQQISSALAKPAQDLATSITNLTALGTARIPALQRCDACQVAAAMGRATLRADAMLYLCGHHLDEHTADLAEAGWLVHDTRTAAQHKKHTNTATKM